MDAFLPEIHINGFEERDLSAGEDLRRTNSNVHVFATGLPSANDPNVRTIFNATQMREFFRLNFCWLRQCGVPERNAVVLAFLKFLNAQASLVSPRYSPADYNVHYSEAVVIPQDVDELARILRPRQEGETADEWDIAIAGQEDDIIDAIGTLEERAAMGPTFLNRAELINQWNDDLEAILPHMDAYDFAWYRANYANLICMVAFVFRTRAHHYLATFDAVYNRLYTRLGLDPNDVDISVQELATTATHAIFPSILDGFWERHKENGSIHGALVKRFDSAPAGSAFVYSLRNGIKDVTTVFPQLRTQNQAIIDALEADYDYLRANRWEGSINHNYYGVARHAIDESTYFAVSSIVFGVYREFVPNAPLIASASLQRLAGNAPVIGAVLGAVLLEVTAAETFIAKYITL